MTNDFDYSVRVKSGASWRQHNAIRLMISVGQPYHEDKKMQATIDWINRNPSIRLVHLSVNDTLQRYNMTAVGIPAKKAEDIARAEGALWIARNAVYFSQIAQPVQTTRWDTWLQHPAFKTAHATLTDIVAQNNILRDGIDRDAQTLLERRLKRGEWIRDTESFLEHSRLYLIEELAVFAIQAVADPAVEIYPGSNLFSAELLAGENLPPALQGLQRRQFTRIDFARIEPRKDRQQTPCANRSIPNRTSRAG